MTVIQRSLSHRRRIRAISTYISAYSHKVLDLGPIAYWPLGEATGTVARCLVNSAQNGAYASDVSGWPPATGIGDGNTAPTFDGTHDYVDIFSATLQAAFDGDEGTLALWFKVADAAVWTDGEERQSVVMLADATNYILLLRPSTNNVYNYTHRAGAAWKSKNKQPVSPTTWMPVAITWTASADECRYYWDGDQTGLDDTLGEWAGNLDTNRTLIGASHKNPLRLWRGSLAHVALFDKPLTPAQIAAIAAL